ncbi:hypothetical protein H8356DRAFT_1430630 [Neocallimastix lanati (nom. inval.)]|uniref:Uncharacterized protein n=1 Tax=Neocallimastix californiae TaxID=1754190 RepID=A0A1Y2DKR7_9FUNG|nr:hypothetical protein H8356DRAFT_1430630 [Neocallimastix sp. JGI-2020a]ORY59345.1 hypothetical protein LY90DRAFT_668848 [Neocallimastix californiae]|eukprot:ORY59345.1 hypothetical protein LY90DRAFT_668848 [Neocallimastix californiae]
MKLLSILFIFILCIVSAKTNLNNNYKRSYEFIDTKCVKLLNEKQRFPLKYHSYSFISNDTYSFLSDCYYKISDDIVICNDTYLHYVYMFRFPLDSFKLYGIDTLKNYCFHNNTEVIKWNLRYKNNTKPEKEFNYGNLKNEQNRKDYSFELIFKNNCTYVMPLQDLNIAKTYKYYNCKDGNIRKI